MKEYIYRIGKLLRFGLTTNEAFNEQLYCLKQRLNFWRSPKTTTRAHSIYRGKMIKRLDSTSTTASSVSAASFNSVNTNRSRHSSTSTTSTSSLAVDPAMIPRAYHRPSDFKAVDNQADTAHNASINRHLLYSSKGNKFKEGNKSEEGKSSLKMKGMMLALSAARV